MHTLIKIDDIPDYDYEGYYWYSDQSAPEVVFQQEKLVFKELLTILPFVVEGNFYAEQEKVSIQIRHIDGEYRIAQFDLKGLDGNTNYPLYSPSAYRQGGKVHYSI